MTGFPEIHEESDKLNTMLKHMNEYTTTQLKRNSVKHLRCFHTRHPHLAT